MTKEYKIKYISAKKFKTLLASEKNGKYSFRGLYIVNDSGSKNIIACDNSDGNAWTEEFIRMQEAIAWLKGYHVKPTGG